MEVAGGKQVTLRVTNGGDGAVGDASIWGYPLFIQAGAETRWKNLRPAVAVGHGTPNAGAFLAEVHWRSHHRTSPTAWYYKAAQWIDKNKTEAEKLNPARTEAVREIVRNNDPTRKNRDARECRSG